MKNEPLSKTGQGLGSNLSNYDNVVITGSL